jgi:hypothetical protein
LHIIAPQSRTIISRESPTQILSGIGSESVTPFAGKFVRKCPEIGARTTTKRPYLLSGEYFASNSFVMNILQRITARRHFKTKEFLPK